MSYWDISQMAQDGDLNARVNACMAQEAPNVAGFNMLIICASPGWDAAWASAIAGNVPNPGRDPGVISDGMILSAVQANYPPS